MAEQQRLPVGMLEEIIESRNYARAYWTYQGNPKATGGLIDDVKRNEFSLVQEAMDAQL